MAALVDRMGQPPGMRWDLFKSYYHVIFEREIEKGISSSDLLRDQRIHIDAIHNQAALLLQIETERESGVESKLSIQRLKSLTRSHLNDEGFRGKCLKELTERIVEAATQRLVFLVGLEVG